MLAKVTCEPNFGLDKSSRKVSHEWFDTLSENKPSNNAPNLQWVLRYDDKQNYKLTTAATLHPNFEYGQLYGLL